MSLRTSLQKLIRRDPASSLRERAAGLQTDLARVIRQPAVSASEPDTTPDPRDAELLALQTEWEARAAAYARALEQQGTISDNAPSVEAPPPREPFEEWARLIPGWRQRTGVEEAEFATAEAMDDLCELEDRISNMPAATLAGLKFKARIAQRNEDVSWPEGLEESLVRDILAIGEPAVEADAELLRLGRQFEAARARETAANEACNAADDEADRHMPERPACLIYRASDARLMVHATMMMGEALDGREIRESDIDWLKRKMPMRHEVLRPIRAGERAHVDHPGRKFDIVPHVEAQARAEEIVVAWEAWQAEQLRVNGEYVTEALDDAANAAGDAAAAIAGRIAALPARSPAGFRVKLRALAHYNSSFFYSTLPDLPDPDQALSHSLWRDVQDELPASAETVAGGATEDLSKAIIGGWAAWGATLGMCDDDGEGTVEYERACKHRDDLLNAAEALPATPENIVAKALARLWIEWVQDERPGQPRETFSFDGRLAFDVNTAIMGQPASEPATRLREPHGISLVGMLDLASASLEDLQALHSMADLVGGVAYAVCWQSRARTRGWTEESAPADYYNAAGKLMQWLGDALTDVGTAANNEARRRSPSNNDDRETRLEMLALPVIQNGDQDETEAFARELLAHVEAERLGR